MQSSVPERSRVSTRRGVPFFILLLLISAARLPAQMLSPETIDGPLTLAKTLLLFRERGFDLAISNAAVAAREADVVIASAIVNPSLSFSRGGTATYDPGQCSTPGCSSTSMGAGITDPGGISDLATGKRRLRTTVARQALDVARSSRADLERTLESLVKQQLLQAELAKRSLEYAGETQKLAAGTLTLVDKRYKAGAVSEADLARAEVQKLEADQSLDAAAQSLTSAKAGLAFLLGFDLMPPEFDIADDLLRGHALPRLAGMSDELMLRDALDRRPDLAQIKAEIRRAQSSLILARRLVLPDVQPSLNYSAEGHGQNAIQPPTLTLGVAVTLPLFYRYRGEIERAEADLKTAEVTKRKTEAQIGNDVAAAMAAFRGANRRVQRMDEQLLARAARARDLVSLQYEKGAVSLFEFLDAQRTWLSTRSEYLQAVNDYWSSIFQLEAATAMELH